MPRKSRLSQKNDILIKKTCTKTTETTFHSSEEK